MGLADMSDSMRHTSIGELRTKYAPKELCPLSAGGRAERFPAGQCEHGDTQLQSPIRWSSIKTGYTLLSGQSSTEQHGTLVPGQRKGFGFFWFVCLFLPTSVSPWHTLRFLQTSPRIDLLMTCQLNYTWESFVTETKECESEDSRTGVREMRMESWMIVFVVNTFLL